MSILSGRFILFFILFFCLYVSLPKKSRVLLLTAGCVFVYAFSGAFAFCVLSAVILWSYCGGRQIAGHKKRGVYLLFFSGLLCLLAVLKALNIVFGTPLPAGASFYILTAAGYLTAVYNGRVREEKGLLPFISYVSFFPAVFSGPIGQADVLLPQLKSDDEPADSEDLLYRGFFRFLWGAFVKLFVANRLAPAVGYIFDAAGYYTGIYHLTAALLFSVQLYADFSSYSDMAIGLAMMLGIRIPENFRNPFLAVSLKELWTRWHISLNRWLTDNLYIPLGGSRFGSTRTALNLILVFFFSGLWHGEGMHFVVWGLYNAALMLIGIWTEPARAALRAKYHLNTKSWYAWLRRGIVFFLFSMAFIFFRASSIEGGIVMTKGILMLRPHELSGFYPQQLFGKSTPAFLWALFFIVLFFFVQYLRREDGALFRRVRRLHQALQIILCAILVILCVFAACKDLTTMNTQFIYSQF